MIQSIWECSRPISDMDAFDLMVSAMPDSDWSYMAAIEESTVTYPMIAHFAIAASDQWGPRIMGLLTPCLHPFMIRAQSIEAFQNIVSLPIKCKYCQEMLHG